MWSTTAKLHKNRARIRWGIRQYKSSTGGKIRQYYCVFMFRVFIGPTTPPALDFQPVTKSKTYEAPSHSLHIASRRYFKKFTRMRLLKFRSTVSWMEVIGEAPNKDMFVSRMCSSTFTNSHIVFFSIDLRTRINFELPFYIEPVELEKIQGSSPHESFNFEKFRSHSPRRERDL